MSIDVVPFVAAHLDAASALLAARHRAGLAKTPVLPPTLGDPAAARTAIEKVCGVADADGWTALDGGQVAGFLFGKRLVFDDASIEALFLDTRAVTIPFAGYAARADGAEKIYRMLYAIAAERWVGSGFLFHSIRTTLDPVGMEPWFSLGFGRRFGHGIRTLGPHPDRPEAPASASASCTIRRAGGADCEAVFRLFVEGVRFHTGSPVFMPVMPDSQLESHRARIKGWLADPAVAIWVAESGGELVGMVQMHPAEGLVEDGIRPVNGAYLYEGHVTAQWRGQGVGVALVERGLAWAREAGYATCVVDWFTANPLSSRFWPRRGFVPFAGQLARRIDPRTLQQGS